MTVMLDDAEIARTLPLDAFDVSDPALFMRDGLYPYFDRLRAEDPVHYCAKSAYGPYWSVTKFNDIVAVDTNHKVFSSDASVGSFVLDDTTLNPVDGGISLPNFLGMDPPRHDAHRMAASPIMSQENLERFEAVMRQRTQFVLDGLPVGAAFDWVDRVSIELTTTMLATLLDFPFAERRRLTRWSDVVTARPETGIISSWEQREKELRECEAFFKKLYVDRQAAAPQPDLISMLAHSTAMQDLGEDEFLGLLVLLIVGGNDTTRSSMSGSAMAAHLYPREFDKVRDNPALMASLVPEIIRWQTPIAHMRRTALSDIEFRGKQIRKGDKVVMWYLSGNRDDEVIERPMDFIADRKRARHHLSFGFGIHRCLGNRLAELQIRVLWEEIFKRFSKIEVVGEPVRVPSNLIHGFMTLPVKVHA